MDSRWKKGKLTERNDLGSTVTKTDNALEERNVRWNNVIQNVNKKISTIVKDWLGKKTKSWSKIKRRLSSKVISSRDQR